MLVQEFKFLPLRKPENSIFRFEIGMDDPANSVHVVETKKELLTNSSHDRQWDTSIIILFYQCQHVLT